MPAFPSLSKSATQELVKMDMPSKKEGAQVRLLIVHYVRLFREGLSVALAKQADMDIVGTSPDAEGAVEQASLLCPDIILVGVTSTDTYTDAIRKLGEAYPGARIVVLGAIGSEDAILACLEAGAIGYVLSDASFSELVRVIASAARDESIVSPRLTASMCRRLVTLRRLVRPVVATGTLPLTRREEEIVRLIVAGFQNKEIAARLGNQPQTVKNHVHNILEKLQLRNRREIARHAQLANLV